MHSSVFKLYCMAALHLKLEFTTVSLVSALLQPILSFACWVYMLHSTCTALCEDILASYVPLSC